MNPVVQRKQVGLAGSLPIRTIQLGAIGRGRFTKGAFCSLETFVLVQSQSPSPSSFEVGRWFVLTIKKASSSPDQFKAIAKSWPFRLGSGQCIRANSRPSARRGHRTGKPSIIGFIATEDFTGGDSIG